MAKKIKAMVKLNLPGGAATPAPPVGPALGQHGVPLMEFVKQYNERTADKKGQIIPAVITIYDDRTFEFITKLPPVAELIKKKLNIKKGAGNVGSEVVGTLTKAQAEEIAKEKMMDLNAKDITAATNIVMGTARSMGVEIK
ncbi:50S ribosomal protein L11 [Candidatus Roizmanbacteria bacterium RIFCSPLOWO2_01_FULL_40_14]|uniref:Large ribosomal subunit protein uL11 n=1 Tax=Candidatus Roizmanbacteria bacterium GW2011_GWB1_40_7 TaxID=1618482 RepID=A0A0G0TC36_9BACT|nr:MAG: 50S ribosomal protein L11 [Candidatus Roizmanbacteria bacterium GW2011_GWB1_40_7]OGK50079.1 MAG: 50S ribosomal protein L11 [Candidatus Roizmanbacteria bacterium RIFCSPLOWO2_01_FULL_40_14]